MEDELEENETSVLNWRLSVSWKVKAETWPPSEAGAEAKDAFEKELTSVEMDLMS